MAHWVLDHVLGGPHLAMLGACHVLLGALLARLGLLGAHNMPVGPWHAALLAAVLAGVPGAWGGPRTALGHGRRCTKQKPNILNKSSS